MPSRSLRRFAPVVLFLSLGACATTRDAWVTLTPIGHRSVQDVQKAEKTFRALDVRASLSESRGRYQANIEIRNTGRKPLHGPEALILEDGKGLIQPLLSADQLKAEVERQAQSAAAYASYPGFYYGYGPRPFFYGRRRHFIYADPFFYDDWMSRQIETNRILSRANNTLAAIDANYLRAQDIPPGATLTGFVQFAKSSAVGPLRLSLKAGKNTFHFEFSPAGVPSSGY